MIGKGATPSFFSIANYNYTLTVLKVKKGSDKILYKVISKERK